MSSIFCPHQSTSYHLPQAQQAANQKHPGIIMPPAVVEMRTKTAQSWSGRIAREMDDQNQCRVESERTVEIIIQKPLGAVRAPWATRSYGKERMCCFQPSKKRMRGNGRQHAATLLHSDSITSDDRTGQV